MELNSPWCDWVEGVDITVKRDEEIVFRLCVWIHSAKVVLDGQPPVSPIVPAAGVTPDLRMLIWQLGSAVNPAWFSVDEQRRSREPIDEPCIIEMWFSMPKDGVVLKKAGFGSHSNKPPDDVSTFIALATGLTKAFLQNQQSPGRRHGWFRRLR
jgi:hypothetical protein